MREPDAALALAISQRHGLPGVVGEVLAARGVRLEAVPAFIEPRLRDWLPDPSALADLDRAAARIAAAVRAKEPIGIIGDYDVDGLTSTALVVRYLRALGIEAATEIPDRLGEGYGATPDAFDRLGAKGCRLCLTLDNGTTAFAPLAHARARGQDVIVVDHHAAEPELPPAVAVVNPKRDDPEGTGLGALAAVGVAFLLVVGVNRALRDLDPALALPDPLRWLDLVALGTSCDVVPLTGLNRAFVRQGLKVAGRSDVPGLRALARAAGLGEPGGNGTGPGGEHLGWALGPRINAASRLGMAGLAARLLVTDDPGEAELLARKLQALNLERREIERTVRRAAEAAVEAEAAAGRPVLVAAGAGWHAGVLGIVAGRLVERHGRPAFVLALDGGLAKGSARSVPGYDVGAAVIAARRLGLVERGGGHAMAAGMQLGAADVPRFAAFLEARAAAGAPARGPAAVPFPIDAAMGVGGVTPALARDLERVGPFGPGNDEPRFAVLGARVVEVREVGDGHLACTLAAEAGAPVRVKAVAFRARGTPLGDALLAPAPGLKLAGRVKADRWGGRVGAKLEIEDAAFD